MEVHIAMHFLRLTAEKLKECGVYDRSEAALRRIIARSRESGVIGKQYVQLATALMKIAPPSPSRDRALKRLADSCDDAIPILEKVQETREHLAGNPSPRRQKGR